MGRDDAGAHATPGGQSGQPRHADAQKLGERLALRFAELRKLLGHMGHRTMALHDLQPQRSVLNTCREAISSQLLGQRVRLAGISVRGDRISVALDHHGRPLPGELRHCFIAVTIPKEPERLDGDIVVGGFEGIPTVRCDGVEASRPAATSTQAPPGPEGRLLACLHVAALDQGVEVPTNCDRAQLELVGEFRRRCRAALQQGPSNSATRVAESGDACGDAGTLDRGFHNIIVAYFLERASSGYSVWRFVRPA